MPHWKRSWASSSWRSWWRASWACTSRTRCGRSRKNGIQIVRTTFFGSIWSEAAAQASVLYQDGALSFTVPDGSVWAFGDTFLGSKDKDGRPQCTGAESCTIAFLKEGANLLPPALDYRVDEKGVADTPFEFLPGESWDRHRIWPGSGIYLDGNCHLYEIVLRLADNPWGPFSPPAASIPVPESQGETTLIYCTYLHPELFRDQGRILVLTFCPMLKNASFQEGFGTPEMVEIEISFQG